MGGARTYKQTNKHSYGRAILLPNRTISSTFESLLTLTTHNFQPHLLRPSVPTEALLVSLMPCHGMASVRWLGMPFHHIVLYPPPVRLTDEAKLCTATPSPLFSWTFFFVFRWTWANEPRTRNVVEVIVIRTTRPCLRPPNRAVCNC